MRYRHTLTRITLLVIQLFQHFLLLHICKRNIFHTETFTRKIFKTLYPKTTSLDLLSDYFLSPFIYIVILSFIPFPKADVWTFSQTLFILDIFSIDPLSSPILTSKISLQIYQSHSFIMSLLFAAPPKNKMILQLISARIKL